MKSTGVVRRIDDLGRIVIPKEIRRTMRIKDGENLEIFVDKEMITLKKFSKMGDIEDISDQLVNIIYNNIKKDILITDRDKIIACSNSLKKSFMLKNISKYLESIIEKRTKIVESSFTNIELVENEVNKFSYIIYPINVNGDIMGLFIILSSSDNISTIDEKIADIVSQFLEKYLEE